MDELRHSHFIYCIQRLENGDYIFLNRYYKPLGFHTSDWINYDDPRLWVGLKGLTAKKAAKISYKNEENLDNIYLYNDGCVPTRSAENMKNYLSRLDALMKLTLEVLPALKDGDSWDIQTTQRFLPTAKFIHSL